MKARVTVFILGAHYAHRVVINDVNEIYAD